MARGEKGKWASGKHDRSGWKSRPGPKPKLYRTAEERDLEVRRLERKASRLRDMTFTPEEAYKKIQLEKYLREELNQAWQLRSHARWPDHDKRLKIS